MLCCATTTFFVTGRLQPLWLRIIYNSCVWFIRGSGTVLSSHHHNRCDSVAKRVAQLGDSLAWCTWYASQCQCMQLSNCLCCQV